jgi:hypothetical protein
LAKYWIAAKLVIREVVTKRFQFAAFAVCAIAAATVNAQEMPAAYETVLKTLGKQGDYKENVLKINLPRNDVKVTVDGVVTPTPFGFGGWLAMTKGAGGHEVLMGDLVLLGQEVNPVMSALLNHGLEVTALHNHFFLEEPRIFFMHVMGHGSAADLASKVKPAVDLIGRGSGSANRSKAGASSVEKHDTRLDTEKLARIIGHKGEQNGAVYKITIGRDDLKIKDMGATINSRMGLNTWAAFIGTDEDAVVAGDVAMLEGEVNPVLKALRRNSIDIVAIHNHMLSVDPPIVFLHCWGRGPSDKLAAAFKAAVDELGKDEHKITKKNIRP